MQPQTGTKANWQPIIPHWLDHHSKNCKKKARRDLALEQTEPLTWWGRRGQTRRRTTWRRTWGQTWWGAWGRTRWSPRGRTWWQQSR